MFVLFPEVMMASALVDVIANRASGNSIFRGMGCRSTENRIYRRMRFVFTPYYYKHKKAAQICKIRAAMYDNYSALI